MEIDEIVKQHNPNKEGIRFTIEVLGNGFKIDSNCEVLKSDGTRSKSAVFHRFDDLTDYLADRCGVMWEAGEE